MHEPPSNQVEKAQGVGLVDGAGPSDGRGQAARDAGPGGLASGGSAAIAMQAGASWKRRWERLAEVFNLRKCMVGPVFERDMRSLGRRGSTYVWRCVLGAAVTFFFIIAMVGSAASFGGGSVIRQIQSQQGLAATLSTVIMWVLAIGAPLIALVLTANLVSQERFAATLEGVATSPLRPLHVIVSGIAARVSQVFIMLAMPVPVLLASRIFGSLELSTIVQSYVVVIFMTITGACVGAYASVKHVRLPQAMSMGIGILVLIQIWPLIALLAETLIMWSRAMMAGGGAPRGAGMPRTLVLMGFAPLAGLVMQSETLSGTAMWGGKLTVVAIGAGVNTLVSAVSVWLATMGLSGLIRRGELSATVTARPGLVSRLMGMMAGRASGKRRQRALAGGGAGGGGGDAVDGEVSAVATIAAPMLMERRSREVGENPVLWREVKLLEGKRMKRWVVGLFLPVLFAVFLVVAIRSPGMLDFETVAIMMTVLGTLVFILRTVTSMSDAVSSERQTGTWTALITTPMEPSKIIHGKLMGPMLRHWPMLTVVLTPAVMAVVTGRGALLLPVMIALIVTMWGIAAQVTGLFLSLVVRKAGAATTLNLGLYLGLWLGLPIALALLDSFMRSGRGSNVGEWVLLLNPVYMVGQTMESGITQAGGWDGRQMSFRVFGDSVSSVVFTCVLAGLWMIVVGAAWGLVRLMIARFAKLSLRGI